MSGSKAHFETIFTDGAMEKITWRITNDDGKIRTTSRLAVANQAFLDGLHVVEKKEMRLYTEASVFIAIVLTQMTEYHDE